MGPFGQSNKKQKDHFRTLSEKEIQQKLYGEFASLDDRPAGEGANEVFMAPKPASAQLPLQEKNLSQELFQPVKGGVKSEEVETDRTRDKLKEQERLARLSEWADEEADAIKKASRLGWYQEARQKRTDPKAVRPAVSFFSAKSLAALSQTLQKACEEAARLFPKNALMRFWNRRVIYSLSGFLFLTLMFLGIHFLNERREIAMKTPRPVQLSNSAKAVGLPHTKKPIKKHSALAEKESPLTPVEKVLEPSSVVVSSTLNSVTTPVAETIQQDAKLFPYVIQIATFATEADAQRLVERLEQEKLRGFMKDLQRATGKVYYSVFIGRYQNYQEAQSSLEEFRKKDISKSFEDAFLRTLS